MDRVAVLCAALVPVFLCLAYGVTRSNTAWRNEALWNAFFLGAVSAIAAIPVELGLQWLILRDSFDPIVHAAVEALFIAAIPEETAKFIVLLAAVRHVDARRWQDTVALAVAVSLGFAALENILYIATLADWHQMAAARAVTAVPSHGVDGLVMGALIVLAGLRAKRLWAMLTLALALPVALHAAYDFPLFVMQKSPAGWAVVLWLAVLAISAGLAIRLSTVSLDAAIDADRRTGRDTRPRILANYYLVGSVMLLGGPLAGVLAAHLMQLPTTGILRLGIGLSLGLIPFVLGLHLIWSAIRRQKESYAENE